jgi:nucleoside-diphosphate-sugar epimerase
MKILIVGNMGYVGSRLVSQLRSTFPSSELAGFDMGYFRNHLVLSDHAPEGMLNRQIIGDVREFPMDMLKEVDSIVYLAAISNDRMGERFKEVTFDVNYRSCIRIAEKAEKAGVRSFVFASSCSIYGTADDLARSEQDELNPLTVYAQSKILAERDLEFMATDHFTVTCLRFATACGLSDRLRLDLVLNNFVAGAVTTGEVRILSNGYPWRPLIHVADMARAIEWAIDRPTASGGKFLSVNTGSKKWNYQVIELAKMVSKIIPGSKVSINGDSLPDKRSYRVNFDLFASLAPDHQPVYELDQTIQELYDAIKRIKSSDRNFSPSTMYRLFTLESHLNAGLLDDQLRWKSKTQIMH